MKNYALVEGDLLTSEAKYIVHQCNCTTTNSAHLSAAMFERFPHADIYSPRKGLSVPLPDQQPGSIVVCGDGESQRFVIAILGQISPGFPRDPRSPKDGFEARIRYFKQALERIAEIPDLHSLAMPYRIGCGAAGGDWVDDYEPMIDEFAGNVDAEVTIYKLKGRR